MGETRPPGAPDRGPAGLRPGEIAKFGAALLASLGVGALLDFFRKRSAMKEAEQEQQRQAEQADELARMRAIGHEPSSVNLRAVLWIAVALVAGGVVVGLALLLLTSYFTERAQRADVPISPLASAQPLPPAPRLEVNPVADWQQLRATAEARLNSYGWADRGAGVVRMPIDRAMDLLAQRGLPARSDAALDQGYEQVHDLESEGGQPPGAAPSPRALGGGP